MNILKDLINTYGTSMDNVGQLLGGLTLAIGSYGLKIVIDKIMNKKGTN
jgi:hypothetical protein